ncbi:hypothetical protein [Streptacidiphilus carbonis]|uniref:hypothetical protein n=1 Tax=Streptacidiphilus carbonis TaxID=105422 RepID=UPI0005A9D37B|nr:hypothetical protein [Streptacidiphilus carbonis]
MSVEFSTDYLQGTSGRSSEPLHVVLRRLVAAVDAGQALPAFLHAAGASQIVADRLQGTVVRPRLLATATTAARGRTGLAAWHVLLRDLAVVLAEAAVSDTEQEAAGILLSVRSSIEGLRRGMSGRAARLHSGARLRLPTGFEEHGLSPEDAVALAAGFAGLRPDRDRPLLVLGLRSCGAYLAPLLAAALGRLDYRHVVTRTTRPGGPLLPEETGLPEAVRRVGGLVLPVGGPPRTGSSLATVIATLSGIGFAAGRILPVYPALDEGDRPPIMLHGHTVVALPASRWARERETD